MRLDFCISKAGNSWTKISRYYESWFMSHNSWLFCVCRHVDQINRSKSFISLYLVSFHFYFVRFQWLTRMTQRAMTHFLWLWRSTKWVIHSEIRKIDFYLGWFHNYKKWFSKCLKMPKCIWSALEWANIFKLSTYPILRVRSRVSSSVGSIINGHMRTTRRGG